MRVYLSVANGDDYKDIAKVIKIIKEMVGDTRIYLITESNHPHELAWELGADGWVPVQKD